MRPKLKLTSQQVARGGEHLVAAEIHLRGGYAAMFTGNMPEVDLIASDRARTRTVQLQVKTRTSGSWHSRTARANKRTPVADETSFWVFVDLIPEAPAFFVVPDWWMENAMFEDYQAYLSRHGGSRPVTPSSTHIGIGTSLIAEWKGRWDQLGILPTD
jgi:hypothetical protein